MEVLSPSSPAEVLELLARHRQEVRLLAGGTDLLVLLKDGRVPQKKLINLQNLNVWRRIEETDQTLEIGSLVSHARIAADPLIAKWAPVLARACQTVGSPQIRNRGTIGGNLGTASPAGDTIPALYVLGAKISLAGSSGIRQVPVEGFITGPGRTVLKSDEVILGLTVPKQLPGDWSNFKKLGSRQALAISLVSAAVKISTGADGRPRDLKIALGSVAPTVVAAELTARNLAEKPPVTGQQLREAVYGVKEEIKPITDLRASAEYRREMAAQLLFELLAGYFVPGGEQQ